MKQEEIIRIDSLYQAVNNNPQNQLAWSDLFNSLDKTMTSIAHNFTNKYQNFNIPYDDLYHAVMKALLNSVMKYNPDNESKCPFYFYFLRAAKLECAGVLRSAKTQAAKVMTEYTSLSYTASTNKDGSELCLEDMIADTVILEDSVISSTENIDEIKAAYSKLNTKDAYIIKVYALVDNKNERKTLLRNYLHTDKDATVRKAVQRARNRFKDALIDARHNGVA